LGKGDLRSWERSITVFMREVYWTAQCTVTIVSLNKTIKIGIAIRPALNVVDPDPVGSELNLK
jgi:hypothetical protein